MVLPKTRELRLRSNRDSPKVLATFATVEIPIPNLDPALGALAGAQTLLQISLKRCELVERSLL